jgi:hypothetical protein
MAQTIERFADDIGGALERAPGSRQVHDVLLRALSGLGFAAVWGLAAGSAAPALAVANIYKVPMVLALSALVALPAVLVIRHLLRIVVTPFVLSSALVTSFYRASLLLLGFAPLLAVYAYTSQWVAPLLAQGSALLALAVGAFSLRSELAKVAAPRLQLWLLGAVASVTIALALLQLVSLATPVLTLPTVFGSGIDGVLR